MCTFACCMWTHTQRYHTTHTHTSHTDHTPHIHSYHTHKHTTHTYKRIYTPHRPHRHHTHKHTMQTHIPTSAHTCHTTQTIHIHTHTRTDAHMHTYTPHTHTHIHMCVHTPHSIHSWKMLTIGMILSYLPSASALNSFNHQKGKTHKVRIGMEARGDLKQRPEVAQGCFSFCLEDSVKLNSPSHGFLGCTATLGSLCSELIGLNQCLCPYWFIFIGNLEERRPTTDMHTVDMHTVDVHTIDVHTVDVHLCIGLASQNRTE